MDCGFFAFLMAMLDKVSKPLVMILDNASIHAAKKLKPYWDLLEEKGTNGSNLNCICRTSIDEIGEGFGDLYKLTFC
jgi:hypothetical protein